MLVTPLVQLPGSNAHLNELVRALRRAGADADFRALVAFVRDNRLIRRLWRALEDFCRSGGRLDWVIGTDLGGTDGDSLRRLLALQREYPSSRVRVMKLPGGAVFHPKFYWVSDANRHLAVLGSANCTGGGFGSNLELSLILEAGRRDNGFALVDEALKRLWEAVDQPRPPLEAADLTALDEHIIARIARYRAAMRRAAGRAPAHPLARARPQQGARRLTGRQLVMELTMEQGEGRITQVQPPRPVWEGYFQVDVNRPGSLSLREDRRGARYRERPVVHHHHNWTIELPEADVPRPALVRFRRTGARTYVYKVLTPGDSGYGAFSRLLETASNPLRRGRGRRWLAY